MKVIHYQDAPGKVFDQEPARGVTGRVVIGQNDGAAKFCMRIFELLPGGHTPKHAHPWEHEIFVHAGRGSLYKEGQWTPIEKDWVIFIPGDEEHQLKNTGEEPLVFVCLVPAGAPEL